VRLARSGEVVLITDRGEVVAQLGLPGEAAAASAFPGLDRLVREGVVRPPNSDPQPDAYGIGDRPSIRPGVALALLDEMRREA
jgi:antitoxin (DNA-binding transcriptional repressor) of toxin-antitoxin stability system